MQAERVIINQRSDFCCCYRCCLFILNLSLSQLVFAPFFSRRLTLICIPIEMRLTVLFCFSSLSSLNLALYTIKNISWESAKSSNESTEKKENRGNCTPNTNIPVDVLSRLTKIVEANNSCVLNFLRCKSLFDPYTEFSFEIALEINL